MNRHLLSLACAAALAAGPLAAASDQPVQPLPGAARQAPDPDRLRTTTLPARGLFVRDQLSAAARKRLLELLVDSAGMDVEVALLVPTGPWQIDGSGQTERDLTPARLQSLRRFFGEHGIDQRRIFVESRIEERIKEPELTVQLVGRPATE